MEAKDSQPRTDGLTTTVRYSESASLDQGVLNGIRPSFPMAKKGSLGICKIGRRKKKRIALDEGAPSHLCREFIRAAGDLPDLRDAFRQRDHRMTRRDAAVELYGAEDQPFVAELPDTDSEVISTPLTNA